MEYYALMTSNRKGLTLMRTFVAANVEMVYQELFELWPTLGLCISCNDVIACPKSWKEVPQFFEDMNYGNDVFYKVIRLDKDMTVLKGDCPKKPSKVAAFIDSNSIRKLDGMYCSERLRMITGATLEEVAQRAAESIIDAVVDRSGDHDLKHFTFELQGSKKVHSRWSVDINKKGVTVTLDGGQTVNDSDENAKDDKVRSQRKKNAKLLAPLKLNERHFNGLLEHLEEDFGGPGEAKAWIEKHLALSQKKQKKILDELFGSDSD